MESKSRVSALGMNGKEKERVHPGYQVYNVYVLYVRVVRLLFLVKNVRTK